MKELCCRNCGINMIKFTYVSGAQVKRSLAGHHFILCELCSELSSLTQLSTEQCTQAEAHDKMKRVQDTQKVHNTRLGAGSSQPQKHTRPDAQPARAESRSTKQQEYAEARQKLCAARLSELRCRVCGLGLSSYDHVSKSTLNMCITGKRDMKIICAVCTPIESVAKT